MSRKYFYHQHHVSPYFVVHHLGDNHRIYEKLNTMTMVVRNENSQHHTHTPHTPKYKHKKKVSIKDQSIFCAISQLPQNQKRWTNGAMRSWHGDHHTTNIQSIKTREVVDCWWIVYYGTLNDGTDWTWCFNLHANVIYSNGSGYWISEVSTFQYLLI